MTFTKFYTLKKLQEIVTEHLIDNFNKYTEWHGGNADQLVYEATEFFNDRYFTADIVDIIVQATRDALDICMTIFRQSPSWQHTSSTVRQQRFTTDHTPEVIRHRRYSNEPLTILVTIIMMH